MPDCPGLVDAARAIQIPRTRFRVYPPPSSEGFLRPSISSSPHGRRPWRLLLSAPLAKQIRGHFSVPWPAYISRRFYSAEARVPRREKGAGRQRSVGLLSGRSSQGGRLGGCRVGVGRRRPERRGEATGSTGSLDVARSAPGFAGNFFSSSLAREMTYDIFLRGFCWLVSG